MSICTFCGNNEYIDGTSCKRCGNWPSFFSGLFKDELLKKWGPFIMDKYHFEYKNNKYIYQDIRHIVFDKLETETRAESMLIWHSEKQELTIYHGDKTVIKEKGKASYFTDEKLMNISSAYRYLSEKSFVQRFNSYASSINTKSYFTYDGCKFFTDGRIETRKNNNILLSDYKIIDYDSFIEFTPREPTIMNRIGQGLSKILINAVLSKKQFHGDLTILTTKDKDVFYSLMFRFYNIKFKLL